MDKMYRYDAFISYRHISPDKPVAVRLQELLETYVPPKDIFPEGNGRKLRLFRDETELPTSSDLSSGIREALESSRFLIVICSSETEKSRWCMEEINYFKALHGGKNSNIMTLLVSTDGQVYFPEPLRYETETALDENGNTVEMKREIEPIAANVSSPDEREMLKKLKTEFLKIAAPILGCRYDDLYQREQRRKKKRKRITVGVTAAVLAVLIAAGGIIAHTIRLKNQQLAQSEREAWLRNANLAVKESKELEANGDTQGAIAAVLKAFPEEGSDDPLINEAVEQTAHLTGEYKERLFTATANFEHPAPIIFWMLADNGKRLITNDNKSLYIWDTESGKRISEYPGDAYSTIGFENQVFESFDYEQYAKGTTRGEDFGDVFLYEDTIRKTAGYEDKPLEENRVYYVEEGGEKNTLHRIDPVDGSYVWSLDIPQNYSVYPAHQEQYIITGDGKEDLRILSSEDGKMLAQASAGELAKLPGGTTVVYGLYNGSELVLFSGDKQYSYLSAFENQNGSLKFLYSDKMDVEHLINSVMRITDDAFYICGLYASSVTRCTPFVEGYNIRDGKRVWKVHDPEIIGGRLFIGGLTRKDDKGAYEVVISTIGNKLYVINAKDGTVYHDIALPDSVEGFHYSQNGYLLLEDAGSREIGVLLSNDLRSIDELTMFRSQVFGGSFDGVCYTNDVYACVKENDNKVVIYRDYINSDVEIFCQRDDGSNKSWSYFALNPSKTYAAANTFEPYSVSVFSTSDASLVANIEVKNQEPLLMRFLTDDVLYVSQYNAVSLYHLPDGKLIRELPRDQYNTNFDEADDKHLSILDKSGNLQVFDISDNSAPETLIQSVKEKDHEMKVERFISSPSMKHYFVELTEYDPKNLSHFVFRIYTEDGSYIDVETGEKFSIVSLQNFVWREDENRLYMLLNNRSIVVFDTESGKKLYEATYEDDLADMTDIGGKLCVLDKMGNLAQVTVDESGLKVEKKISLGLKQPQIKGLSFELLKAKDCGVLSYNDSSTRTGWLFDPEAFEIVYRIDDYAGIDEDRGTVYIKRYDNILTYPLTGAKELYEKAKGMIHTYTKE